MKNFRNFELKELSAENKLAIKGGNKWSGNAYGQGISAAQYALTTHINALPEFTGDPSIFSSSTANIQGVYKHGLSITDQKHCYYLGFMGIMSPSNNPVTWGIQNPLVTGEASKACS